MATANLNILLANTTGSTGIKLFYKLHTSSTWIYTSTYPPSGSTATVTGLSYNFIYNFQLQNMNGTTNPLSTVVSQIGFTCPVPVFNPTNNSIGVTFSNLSTDITVYTLTIALASAPSIVLDTIAISPSGSTVVANFTGLNPAVNYIISIISTAGIFNSAPCTFGVTTLATTGCADPTNITALLTL